MAALSESRQRLGEIIETSTVRIWVESDRLHELPPLGAVVTAAGGSGDLVFAVVSFGVTAGVDATRRAVRRGSDEVRDEEIYRRHPELKQILRTTFEAAPVAFKRDGRIVRIVPPLPPPLHYSVELASGADLCALTDDPQYLSQLTGYRGEVPVEQLIVAHLRAVYAQRTEDVDWLERAAREVARIYKQDYERLLPILEAIEPA
ncbi:MAG TPA: hypothetical protein VFI42_07000 [Thermomicrobiaceae bacterium]|nr:hypothetical protein [Thermomicrobiaceae bacterium]